MADVKLDPVTGEFKVMGSSSLEAVNFNSKDLTLEFEFTHVDYQEKYESKRKGLHDMVEDGDGFTRKEIHDLVLTANKAVWQESQD